MKDKRSDFAEPFDHLSVEKRWRKKWSDTKIYEVDLNNAVDPFYNLMMFPYPSAEGLHVGNVYAFTGSDIFGRFMAMNGKDVFEPIGFDAFGFHSENFAIKRGVHHKKITMQNVQRFRESQLERIGARYDWSHEIQTTDPSYYKWTQWIFLQLFKAGLAQRQKGMVNWCPSCLTVLADEQIINGKCERCDTPVVQKELEQWFLKITKYAEKLLRNLEDLDWSPIIKTAQRNWIGKSEGLEFSLDVVDQPNNKIDVFTTRPDTIFGVTYVVLAPEHPLVEMLVSDSCRESVNNYIEEISYKTELERIASVQKKTGEFIGAYAINPINGDQVPIWIADYVMITYGTGAIMGVPAHDQRDLEFANTFNLPVRRVISDPDYLEHSLSEITDAYTGQGIMVNSGSYNEQLSVDAAKSISEWFEQNGLGKNTVKYRLRDWLISRQRYWGPPIPIIYCDKCGTVPVPEKDLPVLLPELDDWLPTKTGSSPLGKLPDFVNTECPQCRGSAKRETDVSDNFLDSGWYFLRYPSVGIDNKIFDEKLMAKWLPVDMYIGGPEHSVLHLLYSRFLTMALYDLGHLTFDEPYNRFRAHGLITKDGAKMSKSHGNVVNPDEYIERVGADTLRMYLMFLGPFKQGGDFTDDGMGGISRFLKRIWNLAISSNGLYKPGIPEIESLKKLHRTIHRVTEDIKVLKYNTAISALMEYSNWLKNKEEIFEAEIINLLLLLAPFAPYMTEELWDRIGGEYSIHHQAWPDSDPDLLIIERVTIGVQVNGRVRDTIEIDIDASKEEALTVALHSEIINRFINDDRVERVVYIPAKILNIVTQKL